MYEPREDSFLIRKHIHEFCTEDSVVLDMGTGSGILALEASKHCKNVMACDIDKKLITKLKRKHRSSKITFLHSNLFSNIKSKFNLIIFNPPYIPTKKGKTRFIDLDGGKNGIEVIEPFLEQAKQFLRKDGKILLLTSSLNKNIESLFNKYSYSYLALDEEKLAFEKLYVWVLSI